MRRSERQELRRTTARSRQVEYNKLTTQEKWDKMMAAPGNSHKESDRLSSRLAQEALNAAATR